MEMCASHLAISMPYPRPIMLPKIMWIGTLASAGQAVTHARKYNIDDDLDTMRKVLYWCMWWESPFGTLTKQWWWRKKNIKELDIFPTKLANLCLVSNSCEIPAGVKAWSFNYYENVQGIFKDSLIKISQCYFDLNFHKLSFLPCTWFISGFKVN